MAWVRCCGGKKRITLLSPINELILTTPSNTANATTSKRTWTKNSIIKGIADDNHYDTSRSEITNRTSNSFSGTGSAGYGIGLVTLCESGKTYRINFSQSGYNTGLFIMYYASDGTFISSTKLTTNNMDTSFTVPSNAEYVLLMSYFTTTGTTIINKLEEG